MPVRLICADLYCSACADQVCPGCGGHFCENHGRTISAQLVVEDYPPALESMEDTQTAALRTIWLCHRCANESEEWAGSAEPAPPRFLLCGLLIATGYAVSPTSQCDARMPA